VPSPLRPALLLGLLALAACAGAGGDGGGRELEASLRRGLGAADDRRAVDPRAEPWSAVGRVLAEDGAACTGSVVGPRLVLTAAHCVGAGRGRIVFLPAGDPEAAVRAAVVRTPPTAASRSARGAEARFRDDWAFLVLAADVSASAGSLWLDDLRQDEELAALDGRRPLTLAGYSGDLGGRLAAHEGCGLSEADLTRTVFVHDCDGLPGVSGGPLLVRRGDRWAVVGIAAGARIDRDAGGAGALGIVPVAVRASAMLPVYYDLLQSLGALDELPSALRPPGPPRP
jgi:protease YdgD